MKYRLSFPLPQRDDGSLLPALLVLVLALLALVQLIQTNEVSLPQAGVVPTNIPHAEIPEVLPAFASDVVLTHPIFAPRQSASAAQVAKSPSTVLGGAIIAGTITIRHRIFAVVHLINGQTKTMVVGGRLQGWRLMALSPDHATFSRGNDKLSVNYGTGANSVATATESSDR